MAGQVAAVQYEIVETTTVNDGFVGINNHGDLLKRIGAHYEYAIEHDGVTTQIPTTTGSTDFPRGSVLYDISDSGYAFGAASNSYGSGANAAVWSIVAGWQLMPPNRLSEVAGFASNGRCLVRSGSYFGFMNEAYWWQPGSNPIAVTNHPIGQPSGCDLAGNILLGAYNSIIITPTLERRVLWIRGSASYSYFITPGGIACGQSESRLFLFWNTSAQLIESSYQPDSSIYRCNESRVAVGITAGGTRALYYSSATGALQLDSLLTTQFSGWTLTSSFDINDSGQILAKGRAPGSTVDTYCLLNPVPEPSTWLAMGLGTCCLLYRRRRPSRRG